MKALLPIIVVVMLITSAFTANAQTADGMNEGLRVTKTAVTDEYEFSWWGKSGDSYFLQISTDLVNWTFVPDFIEGGANAIKAWGMTTNAPRHFLRLRFTNQTAESLDTADFDDDGLGNLLEITPLNQAGSATDPLDADCDDDTWLDGIEHTSGSLPHDAASTPMTVALARFIQLRSDYDAYRALRQTGTATFAQIIAAYNALMSQWNDLQSLLDDIDGAMPGGGAPTAPMRPGAPAGPGGGAPLPDSPPPEPPSIGYLAGRALTSTYAEGTTTTIDQNWIWNGNSWDMDGPPSENTSTQGGGSWNNTSGAGGTNETLSAAMNPPGDLGSYVDGYDDTYASGHYSTQPAEGGGAPYPDFDGSEEGQTTTTSGTITTDNTTGFASEGKEFVLRRSVEGDRDTLIVQAFLVERNEYTTGNGTPARSYRSVTLSLQPGEMESAGSLTLAANTAVPNTSVSENVDTFGIVPHLDLYNADGSGKLGDLVKSVNANSKVKHFVTPKKTDEIPDTHVVLVAEGLSAADFAEGPNGAPAKYAWSGGEAGAAANQRKVTRANADKVSVKIIDRTGGEVEMIVWVVWAEPGAPNLGAPTEDMYASFIRLDISTSKFEFTIQPQTIITNGERPDMTGSKNADTPSKDKTHVLTNVKLDGGTDVKWDVSRQTRVKIHNPHLYPVSGLPQVPGRFWSGQPAAQTIPEDYPTEKLEGNDDTDNLDETNDPYNNGGKVQAEDKPGMVMNHATGNDEETFSIKIHFKEFVRLNIGSSWYRIANYYPWRAHFNFQKRHGKWRDSNTAPSLIQTNNDGW